MPLTVTLQEKMPGVYVLYPVGPLDANTSQIMEKKVDYLIGEGEAKIITFDMAGVHYISSIIGPDFQTTLLGGFKVEFT